jgi:hypothetical protein
MTYTSHSRPLLAGWHCFLVVVCLPCAGMSEEPRRAFFKTDEVRQQLSDSHARIRAWYVEYESSREGPTVQGEDRYVHRVVAAKSHDRFFHWSTHGTRWSGWKEDPYQQRLTLTPSKIIVERPFHRQFRLLSLGPTDPLPGTMPQEFLFLALGWWPFPNRPMPVLESGVPCGLPAIARSSKYAVNARQELVDGHWCHVLEYPGYDRLLLDSDHGWSILAREVFDPNKGILLQRIESSKHREIQPGIWVPFEFRNIIFDAAPPKSNGPKAVKALDAVLKVLELKLNEDVQDELFRFEPLPGSIQTTADERTEQTIPGGTEYLDELIDCIKRHFNLSAVPNQSSALDMEALLEYLIFGGAMAALVAASIRRCSIGQEHRQ